MLSEEIVRNFIEEILKAESPQMRIIKDKVDELGLVHEEIFPSQMAFFQALCLLKDVKEILELGTFLGYSATGFADFLKNNDLDGHITTVERDPDHIVKAKLLLDANALDMYVTIVEGDVRVVCNELQSEGKTFDLIFLDAFEGHYLELYPYCIELLKPRGMLIIDNMLMLTVDGWRSGRNVIEMTGNPILDTLRNLLNTAASDKRVITSIIPSCSGLLLCVKK